MKGNLVKTSIASDPTPGNIFVEPPTQTKKVVQWLTVRHPEGGVASYPMFQADEGLAWLTMDENLRPRDVVIAVTPCTEQFFVLATNGELDMGRTVEEVQFWAEESKRAAHTSAPAGWKDHGSVATTQRIAEEEAAIDRMLGADCPVVYGMPRELMQGRMIEL